MTLDPNTIESVQSYDQGFKLPDAAGFVLPQKVAIFSPIATAKQSGFTAYDVPKRINSYAEALELYGICPATILMRILKPTTGGGLRSVPVDVFPVEDEDGATVAAGKITPTAAANATAANIHYIKFNGRKSIEGRYCSFSVALDDTIALICDKIVAAINGFLHTPVAATDVSTEVTLASVWKGITANKITIEIDTNGNDCGITYAVVDPKAAAGAAAISTALSNFGETWYTKVLNVFGSSVFDTLHLFNGIPNPETGGTGRWMNTVMKPFIAYTGSIEGDIATLKELMESRTTDLTNELCPAPLSPNYDFEVAAAWIVELAARQNSNPGLSELDAPLVDISGPEDGNVGDMKDFDIRNDLVLNGCSTSIYNGSQYIIKSAITFRRPSSQPPTLVDFKFDRDINIDLNVKHNYRIQEDTHLKGKTLAKDTDVLDADAPVIKPKDWLAIVLTMIEKLVKKGWLADYGYSKANTTVAISETNPNRIDTVFNYKITGVARIMAATAYKSFNVGS
jgi:phage tail sheath gpL-like